MGLFAGKRDWVCIASGIALLPFSVYACVTRPQFSFETMLVLYFFVGFCFWGWTHSALTIGIAFDVEAFAAREKGRARLFGRLLAIFCLCFAYYLLSSQRGSLPAALAWFVLPTKTIGALWTMIGFVHNLKQHQGISLLYGNGNHSLIPRRARFVRLGIYGIMISGVTRAAMLGGILPHRGLAHFVLGWTAISLAVLVLGASYSRGNSGNKRKLLYDLRIFHYALFGWSIIPGLATTALYGIEYYFLTQKMRERAASPEGPAPRGILHWGGINSFAIVAMMIIYALGPTFGLFQNLFAGAPWLPYLTIGVSALSFAVFFVHAYVDYRFFRFRDAENRAHILPLLRRSDSAAA